MLEERDYHYITKQLWDFFTSKYPGGYALPRIAFLNEKFTSIDLHFLKVNLIFLGAQDYKNIQKTSLQQECVFKKLLLPKKLTISELGKI